MPKSAKSKLEAQEAKDLKDLKKLKSKTELYLYKVEKCVKSGGKNMDCKLKIRDEMDKKDREKKAKKPKKK